MTRFAVAVGALGTLVLAACAAPSGTSTPIPTPPVAASGEILILDCPPDAGCAEGFVVGAQFYGLVCSGVEPGAVAGETLASGEGKFVEARTITGIPSEVWLAVRGEIPCEPLDHEWYLAMNGDEVSPEILEQWGEAVGEVTVP